MRYGSVCSGIEAATVAWGPLGWAPAWFAEIEPFARAVLAHHYPDVANLGDFTQIGADAGSIDLLVGGTPCQSFSVAGKRAGLDDPRGNLTLEFLALAGRLRPRWVVWENVPGVLSINEGRTFGAILGALGQLGYGFAYRVLDAQHFGVPQRRRRVFVVGHLGDWRPAAAVLFERSCLQRDPAPRREAGEGVARPITSSIAKHGGAAAGKDSRPHNLVFGGNNTRGPIEMATAVNAHGGPHGRQDFESETFVAGPLTRASSVGGTMTQQDIQAGHVIAQPITGRNGDPGVVAFSCKDHGADVGDTAPTLRALGHNKSHANAGGQVAVAFKPSHYTRGKDGAPAEITPPLSADADKGDQDTLTLPATINSMAVRRLTPVECERLQGFPDGYTAVPWRGKPGEACPDGPRYRALGNSFAVPVVRWIGERIAMVEAIMAAASAAAELREAG